MRGFILSGVASIALACSASPVLAQAQPPAPPAPAATSAPPPQDPATAASSQPQTADTAVPRGPDAQTAGDANKTYPRCSKTVTDNCKQRGA